MVFVLRVAIIYCKGWQPQIHSQNLKFGPSQEATLIFIEKKSPLRYNSEPFYVNPNRFCFNPHAEQAKFNMIQ